MVQNHQRAVEATGICRCSGINQGNWSRKNRCGGVAVTILVKEKLPLESNEFVAMRVQLPRGNITLVEAST